MPLIFFAVTFLDDKYVPNIKLWIVNWFTKRNLRIRNIASLFQRPITQLAYCHSSKCPPLARTQARRRVLHQLRYNIYHLHPVKGRAKYMNEWVYSLGNDNIIHSQAGTPRHDNCMHLPVSWVTISYKKLKPALRIKTVVIKTNERAYAKLTHTIKADAQPTSCNYNVKISRGRLQLQFV